MSIHDRELGLFLRTLNERVDPTILLERVVGGACDDWQRRLMSTTSEIIQVLASRRVGKSTTVGVMAGQELSKPEHQVIIISPTLAQSQLLFAKIANTWERIALPIETSRRTLTEMHLKNGSAVRCVPAGADGEGARGHGIKHGILAYDEAAFIPEKVFGATMAIAEDHCKTVLISTPGGKTGRFYDMWTDLEMFPEVERIRACSLDIPRMAKLVARQKKILSKFEFDVEHGLAFMGRDLVARARDGRRTARCRGIHRRGEQHRADARGGTGGCGMMTDDLHELFCFLQDHVCVAEATITTTDGFDYKLEWKGDDCVVTQTLIHYL